jgi:membrane fusion protein, multidrug efflux system
MTMDTDTRTNLHEEIVDSPRGKTGHASRWVFALVGVCLVGGAVYFMRHRQSEAAGPAAGAPKDRPVPVTVANVVQQDVPIWLEGLGTVTPLATVNVKTLVDGPLVSVNFKEGQNVHKGDLLAQVDPRPFEIALHNAEAGLVRDSAQLRDARLNLERYRTLRAGNLIAQQQFDDQQALVDQYAGTTQLDQAAIDSAKLNLTYSHIVSPIDGVTGVRLIDVGNIVHAADQTYVVVLTQIDPMAVLFTLPEDDLPRVQTALAKGKIEAVAFGRDGQTKLADGELGLIDNEVNMTTATIRLKAFFPNKQRLLWPSEFVKTRLLLSTRKDALTAPATAVQRGPNGTFVYVVGPDETVSARPVEVDLTEGDTAILSKGLKAGEKVVTDGQNQLKPGSKISTRDAKPAGSASAAPAASSSDAPQSVPTGSAGKAHVLGAPAGSSSTNGSTP